MFFKHLCVELQYLEYFIYYLFDLQSKMWEMLQTLQFAFVSVIT